MNMRKTTGSIFFAVVGFLEKLVGYFVIVGLAVIIVLMTMQIINRYALRSPFIWTEELCRYIFVWITIMGAGLALRRFELVGVNLILERVPVKVQNVLRIAGLLGITLFIYILTRYGTQLLIIAAKGKTLSPALRVPMSAVYIIFPIGGTIMFILAIACIVEVITGKRQLDELSNE